MDVNYSDLKLDELKKIHSDVSKAISSYHVRKRREAKVRADELVKEYGFSSIEELISGKSKKIKRNTTLPYYRNPDNHAQTSSKLGRKPAWYHECLKNGYSEEQLKIKNQS